jgi:uncharacterized protein YbbC (DUF1343 family)/CubicO group peptidase (beta-lactamase class C family)
MTRKLSLCVLLCVALVSAGGAKPLDPAKLSLIDDAVQKAIDEHRLPGAVVWVEHGGDIYWKAYGKRSLVPAVEPMTRDTIFDVASLTKVLAGTPAIMLLVERGKVDLDAPVSTYIPEYTGEMGKITVRQLLTHTSGMPPDVSTKSKWQGPETAIQMAAGMKLDSTPGAKFRYSDINLFTVGEIVARVSGMSLDQFCAREIYRPLKMKDTGFLPPAGKISRVAPTQMTDGGGLLTEKTNGAVLRGTVHDPTSRFMGGVAGHAGLFTTAPDMARFARMMLNMGELDGRRIFLPETVKMMTRVQTPPGMEDRRGLGWDIDSRYSSPRGKHFPLGSYGHTGFTGCAFWIDPFSKTFFIFLSNHVHPYGGTGSVVSLYRAIGTLAAEAVTDFNFDSVPGALPPWRPKPERLSATEGPARVLEGIDVLEQDKFAPLKGLRVGLITNPTGQDAQRRSTIDLLRNAPGVELKMLFGPEHGLYGNFDSPVRDGLDSHTGLPAISLYGERHAPTPEQLKQLDALVFDIQDVGCRFYTFTTTLGMCMEAANAAGVKFFVLDRVNPINGVMIDGPVRGASSSFVAYYPEPVRYGLTEGELATMCKAERHWDKLDLTVIKLQGWDRSMWFDQTGLPWINPSPNMRSLTEAMLYPGVGLLEGCRLSVGRGTGTPFEVIGAPYIDDLRLAGAMNAEGLPGIRFVPVRFTPTDNIFKNEACGGVNIILTDRDRCRVVDIGLLAAKILHRWYPEQFQVRKMETLLADEPTLQAIQEDKPLAEIRDLWAAKTADFKARREKYLLYPGAQYSAH